MMIYEKLASTERVMRHVNDVLIVVCDVWMELLKERMMFVECSVQIVMVMK